MVGSLTVCRWGVTSGAVRRGGGRGDVERGGGRGLDEAQAEHQGDQGCAGGAGQVTVEVSEAVHGHLPFRSCAGQALWVWVAGLTWNGAAVVDCTKLMLSTRVITVAAA